MNKRRITAREILSDVRKGLSDPALMEKYKLSAQGLQSVFQKLLKAGIISQAELDARSPLSERTVDIGLYICSACGNIQGKEFTTCPRCGFEPPRGAKSSAADVTKKVPKKRVIRLVSKSEAEQDDSVQEAAPAEPNRIVKCARTVWMVSTVSYGLFVAVLLAVAGFSLGQGSPYATFIVIGVVAAALLGTILFYVSQVFAEIFRQIVAVDSVRTEPSGPDG
ncbi:MAG: hypothetical protein AB1733_04295 [Thermodesulfobacteriota bacterium]